MANKEVTVYIVDLGSTMANCNNGRIESDLDWSMRYLWDRITTTVQASRKTLCLGVVGLRTDETWNTLSNSQEGYENISVLQEIGPMTLPQLKALKNAIKPCGTTSGDAISAIVVAGEMICDFTKQNKWNRKIVLVTDGQGPIDADDVDEIAGRLNEIGIELIVLGVDFDDAEYGFKEEDKPQAKREAEETLKNLVNKCDKGIFGTIAEAVGELDIPRNRPINLVKNYDAPLTIGDAGNYPSTISINVERWPATKVNRPVAATTVVLKSEPGSTQSTVTLGDEMDGVEYDESPFNPLRQHRTYKINDPEAPGGKRDVEFQELAKGYTYGSTAVHIAEADWDITSLGAMKDFSIIGFVSSDKIEPFLGLGETCVTVARSFDEKSQLALSALIHALYEVESYAIGRLVPKDGKDPIILLMRPSIEPDLECLYDVPLPFAEDVRPYRFPPLDKVITVTGKTLTKHRFLPNEKLSQAMSDFVDAMDISEFDKDDDGNPTEYAPLEDLYSPIIHRVNQVIRARAVDPNGSIEKIPQSLLKYSEPPQPLVKDAESEIESLIKAADVKKVEQKAKGRRQQDAQRTPINSKNFDISAILGERPITKGNSIPEFKQVVNRLRDQSDTDEQIENATKDMTQIIHSLIKDSMGGRDYDRALENMGVMREQLLGFEVPGLYNDFLRDLKTKLKSGALGGDRKEMWLKIRYPGQVGLIDNTQSEVSDVTPEEARNFLRS